LWEKTHDEKWCRIRLLDRGKHFDYEEKWSIGCTIAPWAMKEPITRTAVQCCSGIKSEVME
jgi:hypothetical protein